MDVTAGMAGANQNGNCIFSVGHLPHFAVERLIQHLFRMFFHGDKAVPPIVTVQHVEHLAQLNRDLFT